MQTLIFYLFSALLFLVPLILWPHTSEVFEFNKIVVTYILTTLIVSAWAVRMVIERKIIFRRTILDLPILGFLITQSISTILSIDPHTSLFGYYSRFNGGLLSLTTYSLLYWALVSNLNQKDALRLIKVSLASAVIVSIYAVMEHFGIDKDIWVQDVQSRVFSTLGQPNWLAAYVTALIPVSWALSLKENIKSKNFWIYFSISILLFWTLIFTKSRSGLLGFAVGASFFYLLSVLKSRSGILRDKGSKLVLFLVGIVAVCLISGTQWSPSLSQILTNEGAKEEKIQPGTSLETGGTESGTIRKIVWKGALEVWKNYPVFGTGVETFAFSYNLFRPVEHNTTSEWDFIYNKAHNEFLNFAANTGTVGLMSYLILILFVIIAIFKSNMPHQNLKFAFTGGILSLMTSNFFGFSVVPTQLQFFLFPAFAVALSAEDKKSISNQKIDSSQKVFSSVIGLIGLYLIILLINYWKADVYYSKGKGQNSANRPDLGAQNLLKAIKLSPGQAIYHGEAAVSYSSIAMAYSQANDATAAAQFSGLAISSIEKATNLAPANINLMRQQFGVLVRLSTVDERMLLSARETILASLKLAPNDPKLYYNLGVTNANLGDNEEANENFNKAVELKPNYIDARIQYAALLVHLKQNNEAREQLEYILTNIDPANQTAKTALENIN